MKTGQKYKIHLKYCKDKGLKPIGYSTFTSRVNIGWTDKELIFTEHSGWGGDRSVDNLKEQWRKAVKEGYTRSYSYFYTHNKQNEQNNA